MTTQTVLNKYKVESAANTFTSEEVEVPNSQGARAVLLDTVLVQVDPAEGIAATLTETLGGIAVGACKAALDAAGACQASIAGVCALVESRCYGADVKSATCIREFKPQRLVPKSPDGKYYVTIFVKSANNVAAKNVRINASFSVQ